jgi:hypothetical protein
MSRECTEEKLKNLYVVGMALSLTTYSSVMSTFILVTRKNTRNVNLCVASIALLVYNVALAVDYFSVNAIQYSRLFTILHNICILNLSLAAVYRYGVNFEGRTRLLMTTIVNACLFLFHVFTIGFTLFDVLISQSSFANMLSGLTLVIPVGHLIFGVTFAYSWYKRYRIVKFEAKHEIMLQLVLTVFIIMAWIVYIGMWIAGNSTSPYTNTIYLFISGATLLAENSIATEMLDNRGRLSVLHEAPKEVQNFFTTTMADAQSGQLDDNSALG